MREEYISYYVCVGADQVDMLFFDSYKIKRGDIFEYHGYVTDGYPEPVSFRVQHEDYIKLRNKDTGMDDYYLFRNFISVQDLRNSKLIELGIELGIE